MFPYEDSEIVSVRPYTKKRNHSSVFNISPTLVIDTSMERSSRVLKQMNTKNYFIKKNGNMLGLGVSVVMFCKQFLVYAVHVDWSAFLRHH